MRKRPKPTTARAVADRRRFEVRARRLLDEARRFADPDHAVERTLAHHEHRAASAERWRQSEEDLLAELVSKLERCAEAERAAGRASAAADQLRRQRRQEELRVARNARRREKYRRRAQGPRTDHRPPSKAVLVEVDPVAWQALKVEAVKSHASVPRLLGLLVIADLATGDYPSAGRDRDAPRWRRTGQGRRARQNARIEVDDETWATLRVNAAERQLTIARRVGIAVERWLSDRS